MNLAVVAILSGKKYQNDWAYRSMIKISFNRLLKKPDFLRILSKSYAFVGRDHTGSSLSDQVYAAQTQVIRNLSEKGSCIIIGRCADYILKDRPDTYHIFVYGDEYEKISRTQQLFNLSEKDARAMNRDMDKKRRLHYEYYTDRKWGDPGNHCMCLNTSALDMERCIRYILDLFE